MTVSGDIKKNGISPVISRVSIDWLEFTLFDRLPDILRGENLTFEEVMKATMPGTGTDAQEEVERLMKKHRPERWEKEMEVYESHPWSVLQVCALLGQYGKDAVLQDRGAQGYLSRHITGCGVVILSQGSPGMGVHVSLTGDVCQSIDDLPDLLRAARAEGAKLSRFDLAIDDCDGALDLRLLVDKCRAGECASRMKTFLVMEGGKVKDGEPTGLTLYLGKKDSDFMARIYDKRLESIFEKGIAPAELPGHWIRAEMQCSGVAANNAALELVGGDKFVDGARVRVEPRPLPELAAGILSNYVSFKDRGEDSNKGRWKVSGFWQDFIAGAQKLSVSKQIFQTTIERRAKWFGKQCSASVAMLLQTHGQKLMTDVVVTAGLNLTDQQTAEVINYKRKKARKDLQRQDPAILQNFSETSGNDNES